MRVDLPSGTPAEVARPLGEPTRGLVLLPDIGGLRALFDDLCARLAAEHGWVVVAPEPWPGRESWSLEDRLSGVGSLSDEQVLTDARDAAELTGADPARVAVLGFCMGGMFALKAAATGRFDRAVSFYGMVRLPEHWRSDTVGEPLDALTGLDHAPILHLCGTADPFVPEPDLDALAALEGTEVVRYPGADHGFVHDPSRPSHRPADAADAWARVATFLA